MVKLLMSNRIENRAREIKNQAVRQETNRQWHLHAHGVIVARAPEIFDGLGSAITKEVTDFNAQFPHDPRKRILTCQRTSQTSFLLKKGNYPSFELELNFDADSHAIRFNWTKDSGIGTSPDGKGVFEIRLNDETGNPYILKSGQPVTFGEAARDLLEQLLQSS